MKKNIVGTGLTGLVGSRVVDLLNHEYDFENLSLDTGVNILDKKKVEERISKSNAKWVFHFAAKTDVDACEKDKIMGENGDAWKINVEGTKNIVNACQKFNKNILYISTDFIFDGKDNKFYSEDDKPNPINWYGLTKYEGEKKVIESGIKFLICRISFPYRSFFPLKKDLIRVILDKLKNNEVVKAISDQFITPTFIDDIAVGIRKLIQGDLSGIYHLNGDSALTPYEISAKIADVFGLNRDLIEKVSGEEYFKNRAKRPFHAVMKNDKIKYLSVEMSTLEKGLVIMKQQMEEQK